MPRAALLITAVLLLVAPATASADFVHVVAPGESLTSIAAADGLTVDQLAGANGISPYTQLVAGTDIQIPPQGGAPAATQGVAQSATQGAAAAAQGDGDSDGDDAQYVSTATPASAASSNGGSYVVQPGDTLSAIAARAGIGVNELAAANGIDPNAPLLAGAVLRLSRTGTSPVNSAPSTGGSYVVQPGDTLTAIAARAGMSIAQLAANNGIDPNAPLLIGTVLRLSGTSGTTTFVSSTTGSGGSAATQPVGAAAQGNSTDPPYPTVETVTAGQVGSIASANGVSPSLADAIAYQESGFNNDLVSSADARGVMQILPGTWQWIQRTLVAGGPPLAPASATDNVRGGVLLIRSLLNSAGGDPATAAAGYFQGLPSVEQNGVYPATQQYVNDVMALRQRFGGG
jgi:LysM repeat protein